MREGRGAALVLRQVLAAVVMALAAASALALHQLSSPAHVDVAQHFSGVRAGDSSGQGSASRGDVNPTSVTARASEASAGDACTSAGCGPHLMALSFCLLALTLALHILVSLRPALVCLWLVASRRLERSVRSTPGRPSTAVSLVQLSIWRT